MHSAKSLWTSIIILLVVAGGIYLWSGRVVIAPTKEITDSTQTNSDLPPVVITFDENGFTPNEVTIKAGQKVEWVNKSGKDFWPATNIHPTHTLYPDSSIFKCLTPEELTIFDACRPVGFGKGYTFTFNSVGEWRYHDHLRANKTGIIRVE